MALVTKDNIEINSDNWTEILDTGNSSGYIVVFQGDCYIAFTNNNSNDEPSVPGFLVSSDPREIEVPSGTKVWGRKGKLSSYSIITPNIIE